MSIIKTASWENVRKYILTDEEYIYSSIMPRIHKYCPDFQSDPESCWEWIGYTDSSGYAFLGVAKPKVGKTNIRVSQIIFILYKGKLTKKCVCHSCDNRLCINPNHLWEGTVLDNSKDMVEKGRSTWKLTPQEVAEIYNSKEMGTVLASKYNVSQATISQIRHRKQQLYLTQGYLLC